MEVVHDKVSGDDLRYALPGTDLNIGDERSLVSQRVIVYPAYIDSKKTIAGGRKITKQKGSVLCHYCLLLSD